MKKRGCHDFSFKIFCLTVSKNFVDEQFGVSENFGYRKNFLHEKGISRFSVENFLSHSTEKLRRRTLLCFRKILVSKIFMHRREASWFCRNFFVSQDRKISLRGPFCVSEIFWYEKNFLDEIGGITFFRRKFFVSQGKKNSWGNASMFQNIRVSKNFMHKKGISLFSVENIMSHSTEKIRRGTLCFKKIRVSKIFMHERGGASRYCRKKSHRTETKNLARETSCFP